MDWAVRKAQEPKGSPGTSSWPGCSLSSPRASVVSHTLASRTAGAALAADGAVTAVSAMALLLSRTNGISVQLGSCVTIGDLSNTSSVNHHFP